MKTSCCFCKRSLTLVEASTGKCKCDNVFCKKHKLPEDHECSYNFHENFKKELKETMQVVKESKVTVI